jgi:hypothetical protein
VQLCGSNLSLADTSVAAGASPFTPYVFPVLVHPQSSARPFTVYLFPLRPNSVSCVKWFQLQGGSASCIRFFCHPVGGSASCIVIQS